MAFTNISFVGAGRVASVLAQRIYESGYKIGLIVSPTETSGRKLAESCGTQWSTEPVFPLSAGMIVVAVPDHSLGKVLAGLTCGPDTLVAHTAGSIGLDIFPSHIEKKGVFYPLQTFTAGRKPEFNDLPFLLESPDNGSLALLEELAVIIGGRPYIMDSPRRRLVHLAAVFICNFTNHMLTSGKRVADNAHVPFELFFPLIRETVSKAMEDGPDKVQTGPAVRNDRNIIEKHLELLSFSPDLRNIYREITDSIINYYNKS